MEGVLMNFRGGKHTKHNSQMILYVAGVTNKEQAAKLIGKSVTWLSPAKKAIAGKVLAPHGNSGATRVKFETGMPGQAVGSKVRIE